MFSVAAHAHSRPSIGLTGKLALKATAPVVDGYKVIVATDKKVYMAGEKVNLTLTIKNMARDQVNLGFGGDFGNFEVNVLGPDGEKVKYTPYGREVFNAIQGGSNSVQTLNQGSERYVKVDINHYYDMSQPGRYKITFYRRLPKRGKSDQYVTVSSNLVVVTIGLIEPRHASPLHANLGKSRLAPIQEG
jgi:uncharacterized protein YfaS (alpha-2-macroglobulin family)